MVPYVTLVEWKHVSVRLVTMLVLAQERCTVRTVRCIGLEVVLDAPDSTPWLIEWKHVSVCLETMLVLAQERCTVGAVRCIGLEVVLDARDGTPK